MVPHGSAELTHFGRVVPSRDFSPRPSTFYSCSNQTDTYKRPVNGQEPQQKSFPAAAIESHTCSLKQLHSLHTLSTLLDNIPTMKFSVSLSTLLLAALSLGVSALPTPANNDIQARGIGGGGGVAQDWRREPEVAVELSQ